MRLIHIPVILMLAITVADRAAPGYGKFSFWVGIGQPISKIANGPRDCSRALSREEFKALKTMKGATQSELAAMFAGAVCETGIRLDFSDKKITPEMSGGKLERLKVVAQ
jgi:hypothetical protein